MEKVMDVIRKVRPFGQRAISIADVYQYADGIEEEVTREIIQVLKDPNRGKEQVYEAQYPQNTLVMVDEVVRYIVDNWRKSPSYWGAKFSLRPYFDEIPFQKPKWEMVFADNRTAFDIYAVLQAFYRLLCTPEYRELNYCASIEAAKQALLTVYPRNFVELPPTAFPLPEGVSELELKKAITELVLPAADRFNLAIDKIAEIVSSTGYRSKVARESAKLKSQAASVTTLISGLLRHHQSLTVVAVRLSIRQSHASDFIGEKMQKGLSRLIGDRRSDPLLNSAVGYFWVLQESYNARFRQRISTVQKQNVAGGIALHYDLVLFFDKTRYREVEAISTHIGECWKFVTNEAGFYRSLSGRSFKPYISIREHGHLQRTGTFPPERDFVGHVMEGSIQAKNLETAARVMVYSAVLRKPTKQAVTLMKSTARRFGKSDLLTGCGFDKAGRGTKTGHSGVKHERKRRPKYLALEFGVG
jgi:hypothetical protein